MFTFCEPSGPVCAWEDDRKRIDAQRRDCFDVFVSDDIASYPPSFPGDATPAIEEARNTPEPVPSACRQPASVDSHQSVCRQPANELYGAATAVVGGERPAAVTHHRQIQSPARRLHQSNAGSQRQMGGVKLTNRFFARRQFA